MLPLRVRVNLGVMAKNGCSTFSKAPALLEPHRQVVWCYIQDTSCGVGVLSLCWGVVGVFYNPSRLGNLADEYPLLSPKAVKMQLPFATTYLCETAFFYTYQYDDQIQISTSVKYQSKKYHEELTICTKQSKHISLTKCHYSVQILDVIFIKWFL